MNNEMAKKLTSITGTRGKSPSNNDLPSGNEIVSRTKTSPGKVSTITYPSNKITNTQVTPGQWKTKDSI